MLFLCIPLSQISLLIKDGFGHKFIDSSSILNNDFDTAITIPNHTLSWVIYHELDKRENKAKYYKFENNKINSSFYAQITIPKNESIKIYPCIISYLSCFE